MVVVARAARNNNKKQEEKPKINRERERNGEGREEVKKKNSNWRHTGGCFNFPVVFPSAVITRDEQVSYGRRR